ncbi:hypothetical protein EV175_005373 [Coemansia sp. RSA 1933]|nr:hypothetical protein EV175_005373 [Coemansia sp. RSA 1933]
MASYEEERTRLMRENEEYMASLGIGEIVPKKTAAPKNRESKARDADAYAPTREHNMRKRSKSISYRENDYYKDIGYRRQSKSKKRSGSPKLRRANPGRRFVGGREYDSEKGSTCHQCRQKTMDPKIGCCSSTCNIMFDYRCLLVRYNEDAETIEHAGWMCPKCRGTCNCSFCMKRRGRMPTGQLSTFIKTYGSDKAQAMIQSDNINPDVMLTAQGGRVVRRSAPRSAIERLDLLGLLDYESADEDVRASSDSERTVYRLRERNTTTRKAIAESLSGLESSDEDIDSELVFTGWDQCPPNIDWIVLIDG